MVFLIVYHMIGIASFVLQRASLRNNVLAIRGFRSQAASILMVVSYGLLSLITHGLMSVLHLQIADSDSLCRFEWELITMLGISYFVVISLCMWNYFRVYYIVGDQEVISYDIRKTKVRMIHRNVSWDADFLFGAGLGRIKKSFRVAPIHDT